MRQLYFFIVLLLLLSACGSSGAANDKLDKKALFGTWETDDLYKNAAFNIQVEFDKNWKVQRPRFKSLFGGDLFEATYLPSVHEMPINITMTVDQKNPFKKVSVLEELQESLDGYEMLFDEDEMIKSPISKTKIAGEEYAYFKLTFPDDGDSSYVTEYYRYSKGYYISIISYYNTTADEPVALDFIANIKRLK